MANRSEQAKLRKKHSRGRYARFSGATTRYASSRIIERIQPVATVDDPEALDHVKVKSIEIFVGRVSLSKQVINGSKSSVNTERMEEYFTRIRTKDQPLTIAEVFGVHGSAYQKLWDEIPYGGKCNFYSNELGRLDMIWHGRVCFFVEVDTIDGVVRRSRDYGTANRAKDAYNSENIRWVEKIPIK